MKRFLLVAMCALPTVLCGRTVLAQDVYKTKIRPFLEAHCTDSHGTALKKILPEDNTAAGFDNISAALEISAAHLMCYQQAAEAAVSAAIPRAPFMEFDEKRTGKQMVERSAQFKEAIRGSGYVKDDAVV